MNERKNPLLKDEEVSSSEENSPEFIELQSFFNTLLNDNSKKKYINMNHNFIFL